MPRIASRVSVWPIHGNLEIDMEDLNNLLLSAEQWALATYRCPKPWVSVFPLQSLQLGRTPLQELQSQRAYNFILIAMLQTLAVEIVSLILSHISSVTDLLSFRQVSKAFATHAESRLRQIAFKNIRLPLDDSYRLVDAMNHVANSSYSDNIRWVTICGLHNLFALQGGDRMMLLASSGAKSDHDHLDARLHLPYRLLERILTLLSQRTMAPEELRIEAMSQRLRRDLGQARYTSRFAMDPGQSPTQQSQFQAMAYSSDNAIANLTRLTARTIISWRQAQLHVSVLELDGTVLALGDIGHLSKAMKATNGIRRISLRLQEHMNQVKMSQAEVLSKAQDFADVVGEQLEQLVLSSTCLQLEVAAHNFFLNSFLDVARLHRLSYLQLEGFCVIYSVLLLFLERHSGTLVEHGYRDIEFDGLNDLEDDEFERVLSHDLEARALSHLSLSLVSSTDGDL